MKENTYRINAVDALRGFAILGILLMHSYEQYNILAHLHTDNKIMLFMDRALKDGIPFLFAGKAYAVFALLFGFSFFIQFNNQAQKGVDFSLRFVWRMVLLFLWGCLNSVFYTGDVLITFSLLGLLLPLATRISDKTLLCIALLFFLQPGQWIHMICASVNPDYTVTSHVGGYYRHALAFMKEGNIVDLLTSAYHNQLFSFFWWMESGRVYQVVALFLLGLLLARNRMFSNTEKNIRFWIMTLIIGIVCFFPVSGLISILPDFIENAIIKRQVHILLDAYMSFTLFAIIVSIIIIAYYKHNRLGSLLSKLEPYGKMSLTMYVSQSIMGGFIFYHWGLGLYPKLTITWSVVAGLLIFAIQYTFAVLWLKRHTHGPLEYIWKRLTWIHIFHSRKKTSNT